jgi:MFS family permease
MVTSSHVAAARTGVALVFAMNGLGIATWMSRIPQVRTSLDLDPSDLGRILLALAFGSLTALPTAGILVGRFGAARVVAGSSVLFAAAVALAGFGADQLGQPWVVAVALAGLGYGAGACDVAMNVEGAAVERQLGRTIMPRFHAAFSLGTVAGAGVGAAATALDIGVGIHLAVVGITAGVLSVVGSRQFLPHQVESDGSSGSSMRIVLRTWREPRTLAIGLGVMAFALMEGIANDWLAIGLIDGYEVADHVGTIGFAVFVTAMTLGRLVGTNAVDRFGRVPVLLTTAAMTAGGTLIVVFGGSIAVAMIGVVLWGFGASLGFPLGMSAASDDGDRAAARVSVVASIGYTAFLAGPPILGYLGDHEGVLRALLVVVAAAVVGALASPAARRRETPAPPASSPSPSERR